MKKTVQIFFLLSFLLTVRGQNIFNFEFDFAQFKADTTSNLVEIYFQYDPEKFTQKSENEDSFISNKIIFTFSNLITKEIVAVDSVISNFSSSDLVTDSSKNEIIGVNKKILKQGLYEINIFVQDLVDTSRILRLTDNLQVSSFSTSQPVVSEIQLARDITSAKSNSTFTKNTLKVVPNPDASYSSDYPLLNYYAELYNVNDKKLELSTFVLDKDSKIVFSKSKSIATKNNSIVEVGRTNLLRFPSGVYNLQLIIADSTKDYAFISQKQFYFYNKFYTKKQTENSSSQELKSQFAFLSEDECDQIFEMSKYIATDQEKNQYESLTDVESKRKFLSQFWNKRNIDKSGDNIEYDDYMQRVAEANEKFKNIGGPGYKSDMGRIYLTYGKPDRIERYPNESNKKPYEIWFYDSIEGGVYFVFGDLRGLSEYELLHSTKRGEYFDESWQQRLSIY